MSKLGIVIIEDFDGALRWCIANKPTAIEFMMTRPFDEHVKSLVRDLVAASPKTLLVVRAYPDDYDHPDFQDRMLSWTEPLRAISNRVVAHSVNEVVPFNAEEAKRLNEYEIGFIQRMGAAGLIPMSFCLSESHLGGPTFDQQGNVVNWGNLPLWQYMASGVEALAKAKGFLGLNEYDWPSWNSSRDKGFKWRLGHWELNLQFIQRYINGPLPAVGVGESVLDGKIWTSRLPTDHLLHNKPYGYKKIKSGLDYLADIDKIHKDCYNRPQVAFNLLFAWAPNHPHWNSYDVSVMGDLLANYLKANPPQYWEPKGNNMDLQVNIPGMVDLRETIQKHPTKKYNRRSVDQIKSIALHHIGVIWPVAPESTARYHVVDCDWPGVGYHFQIQRDGKFYWLNSLEAISYHVGGMNNVPAIGICFEGDLRSQPPTESQTQSGVLLINGLRKALGSELPLLGHREYPNTSTVCPGLNDTDLARWKAALIPQKPIEDPELIALRKKYQDLWNAATAAKNTLNAELSKE